MTCKNQDMKRKYLVFIALVITIIYGVSFTLFSSDGPPTAYSAIGGAVVALAWIAVGFFGKDEHETDTRR